VKMQTSETNSWRDRFFMCDPLRCALGRFMRAFFAFGSNFLVVTQSILAGRD
jgi:hypothetical protein